MTRTLVLLFLLLAASAPAPARAADRELTCDVLLALVGLTPLEEIVNAVQDPSNTVRRDTLACLTDAEAPAQLVQAVRQRLGVEGAASETSTAPWVTVDPKDPAWPEALGSALARQIRLVAPGEVPLVVLFRRSDADPLLPWWYVELRDRVAASILLALPTRSAAAESPLVLGDDAHRLTDPSAQDEVVERLRNMGFRRVLLLSEAPAIGTQGIDLAFTVRPLDAGPERSSVVRAVPSNVEASTEQVRFLVLTSSAVRPGERVLAEVSALREGEAPCTAVEAWAGGLLVGRLSDEGGGTFLLRALVPEGVQGRAWTLSLGCQLGDGGVAWRNVELPLSSGDGADRPVRAVSERAAPEAPGGRVQRSRRGVVKAPGLLVGLGLGGGLHITGDGTSLLRSDGPLSTFNAWNQPYDEVYQTAAVVSIPLEVALQLPGVRVGAELAFQPVGNRDSVGWTSRINTYDGGLTEVLARPVWTFHAGGSLGFGARGPKFGIYIGGWVAHELRHAVAVADGEEQTLVGGTGVFGPTISMDFAVKGPIGMGLDLRGGGLTFDATGAPPGAPGGSASVLMQLRVFYRVL